MQLIVNSSLYLKSLSEKDAPLLFAIIDANREYLRQWLPWVDQTQSMQDSLAFIQFVQSQQAEDKSLTMGLWHEGQLVGTVSLVEINHGTRCAEMGYWIIENKRGKGLVTQACNRLLTYALQERSDIEKVVTRCVTENQRSLRVIQRLNLECSPTQETQYVRGEQQDNVSVTLGLAVRGVWSPQKRPQQVQLIIPTSLWADPETKAAADTLDFQISQTSFANPPTDFKQPGL